MSRSVTFTEAELLEAKRIIASFKGADALLEALTITITATTGATLDQVAEIIGKSRETAVRMRARFRAARVADQPAPPRGSGGRRRQLLSVDDEIAFLQPWIETAKTGQMLIVSPIHQALELRVGRRVATATTYAMLARHGWRKIQPDTRHPMADEAAQETFKKTSPPSFSRLGRWLPPQA